MLSHPDLYSLEQYARIRPEFRAQVIEHKRQRRLALGPHATLHFEDTLTMQYQVQEMLRLERIFEPEAIQEELDVYNPLIPDGRNWKATFMLEYGDVEERDAALRHLIGIEKAVWLKIDGLPSIVPIADEDLDRTSEDQTAAVHFLRFELAVEMISAVHSGAAISAGIDHPWYQVEVNPLPQPLQQQLLGDLNLN